MSAASSVAHCQGSKQFALIPVEWASRITQASDLRVFIVLAAHANKSTRECHPSIARISALTKLNERTVSRALRSLESIGAVSAFARKNASSTYRISCIPSAYLDEERREVTSELEAFLRDKVAAGVRFSFENLSSKKGARTTPHVRYSGGSTKLHAEIHAAFPSFIDRMPWIVFCETIRRVEAAAKKAETA